MNTVQTPRPMQLGAPVSYCALVVSPDPLLSGMLRELLEQQSCFPRLVKSYDEAKSLLATTTVQHAFVDLRPSTMNQSPKELLALLADESSPARTVIGIGGVGYDPDWAHLADVVFQDHLPLPLSAPELQRTLQARYVAYRQNSMTRPWTIETDKFQFVTFTPEMYEMMDHLVRMAAHNVTLLLVGETGTGKTTMANLVHSLSPRAKQPFLTVACGALPPELIESELFGHVRGAFTSADRTKAGKFDVADCGSLLLDEIDVLGPAQQAKLLRVIETGEYEAVGSNETRVSQARLVVASNVDLREKMERNEFRSDLYYRLNVLEFRIPSLRQRPNDIVPLTLGFIREFCESYKISIRRIHPEFLSLLKRYPWPGNIRELKNHIRRAVLFCRSGELAPQDLAPSLLESEIMPDASPGFGLATLSSSRSVEVLPATADANLEQRMDAAEREIVEATLRAHDFRRSSAAAALGISRVALYKKMKKYGLLTRFPRRSAAAEVSNESAAQLRRSKPK